MVRRIILDLLINSGSFAWLGVIRKLLFDYFNIYIPLTWWSLIPAIGLVIAINLKVDEWIDSGVIKWNK
ncbi:hypothetical protein ACN077_20825 [Clostridium chromiireducens]|uniref:hypothetical protein n=1 Tax=Clostridium chromiireducens TaxID=225345 RepID=UPI003AF9FBBE